MTTLDLLHIAATITTVAAAITVLYRLRTMVTAEARDKAEHAARMKSYRDVEAYHARIARQFSGDNEMRIWHTDN
jgi:hypothetical protein